MGTVRHLFPGGNTWQGFYSFYEYIIKEDAARKYVIKGGPGVGKSTFMKKTGDYFAGKGFNIEYHWCSSDNDSLDAVVLSDHQIALVDGTAPHVVDPRHPGAVDEIINLGEFWDEDLLRSERGKIIASNHRIGQLFRLAYLRLHEAKLIWDQWAEMQSDAVPNSLPEQIFRQIRNKLQDSGAANRGNGVRTRHLFASAITPAGLVTKIPSLLTDARLVLTIKGSPGTGLERVMLRILDWAESEGFCVEALHNPLIPQHLEMILFPESDSAVVACSPAFDYGEALVNADNPGGFDLDDFIGQDQTGGFVQRLADARERFKSALNGGIDLIREAKREHDLMEQYYVRAMDFAAVERRMGQVIAGIEKLAGLPGTC